MFGSGNHFYEANAVLVEELKAHIKHLEGEIQFLQNIIDKARQ